jgi:UDP-2,3-diacylglucosamine pyrophosphatase LpxH
MGGLISCCGQLQAKGEDCQQWIDKDKIKTEWDLQLKNAKPIKISTKPIVVISDVHLGNGDEKTDAFMGVKKLWMKAMNEFYFAKDFALIELGDIEDRWLFSFAEIIKAHEDVFKLRQKFYNKNRLYKVIGNHDDVYYDDAYVTKELEDWFPNIQIFESIMLNDQFFMMHGHQGTYDKEVSKCNAFCLANCWVPCLKCVNQDKKSYQTPSNNVDVYHALDKIANEWIAEKKVNTILGHTHHPVVHETETKGCVQKDNLYYFNTGCCINNDGSFTALEIYPEFIQLVRWNAKEGRVILETTRHFGKKI